MNSKPTSHLPIRIGLLIAVLLLLSGCGSTPATPVKTVTQRQTVDELTIALEAPERPELLGEQELLISLTDASGHPIDGAEVWLALVMPTMQMSPNEPDAIAEGNGRYRTKVIFTMPGTWNLEVHATIQDQEYIATFHAATR